MAFHLMPLVNITEMLALQESIVVYIVYPCTTYVHGNICVCVCLYKYINFVIGHFIGFIIF